MRIVIVEDNKNQQGLLNNYIDKVMKDKNLSYSIEFYDNAESFINEYTKPTSLVFMDIQLKGKMNGMECAKRLRQIDNEALLIFVTNMA